MSELSHFDDRGAARLVDVSEKPATLRLARATAEVLLSATGMQVIRQRRGAKGDVLQVARLAGIMAAKRTAEIIPLCHTLPLEAVEVDFHEIDELHLGISASARVTARTGVEMEALVAASVAALTIYDMLKSTDRGIRIENVQLMEKSGGRSGAYSRSGAAVATEPGGAQSL
jgi:cyclic pyranopterin phosphate synthase